MRKPLGHQYQENDFICVLTQDLILQPLELECGHAFEANSLRGYFNAGHNVCPTCRAPANRNDMQPPVADLRGQIEAYARARPMQYPNFIQERNQADAGVVAQEDQQILAAAQHNYNQAVQQAELNDVLAAAGDDAIGVNLGEEDEDLQGNAGAAMAGENEDPELLAMLEEIRLAEEQNAQQGAIGAVAAGAAIVQQNDEDHELLDALEQIRLMEENAQQEGAAIVQQDDEDELLEAVRLSLEEDDDQENADVGNAAAAINHQQPQPILNGFQMAVAAAAQAQAQAQDQNANNNALREQLKALRKPGLNL